MELDFEQPLAEVEQRIAELTKLNSKAPDPKFDAEIAELHGKMASLRERLYASLSPWQVVQIARHPDRPHLQDYIAGMCADFVELHGDRRFGDDGAMRCGFATIGEAKIMLIGTEKGKSVEEKERRRFGHANPEGYRKALRLMKLAEKYRLPIVCLVDTPAANPGTEAEARGQAEAIARNLMEMAGLDVPIVVVITGEGGSGGALGIAVGDIVLMLSYAIYSVIPPEGCAEILWRDPAQAPQAAEALKLTADALLELKIVDGVIAEPPGGAHREPAATIAAVKAEILKHLGQLERTSPRRLVEKRYEKYAKIGRPG